ncbi:HET-domain-containing protein [Fusarium austroafricanum]|uniref:HET-domain-containing protein n=1 Tax=Fusarium austroafricanum TaxID=2364996 RepID=A0A8H4KF12_9HYPO|nr:HET-domain-containing protein [Fusarium austroafricanum]
MFEFACKRRQYSSTEYDALSYTWGDQTKIGVIIVNGKRLGIAQNLNTALLRLRHRTEARRLWIDAICIDQTNVIERNHQVGMMQRVFSAASSVIVWLGDPEHNEAFTLDMILDHNNSLKGRKSIFSYDEKALDGVRSLFRKPWWRRIWIVQEVVAARVLVVLLGRTTFPWIFLRELCTTVRQEEFTKHSLAAVLGQCGYQKFTALDSLRRSRAKPLVRLLQSTQDYQATDPRDKLYALLGMASDISAEDFVPDYSKPVRQVFEELIAFMAVHRKNLDLICLGHFNDQTQASPSWLPCWQPSAGIRPLSGRNLVDSTERDTKAVVDMTQFPHKLIAEGIIVDNIQLDGGSATIVHECWSTIQRWQNLAEQNEKCGMWDFLRGIIVNEDYLNTGVTWSYTDFASFMSGSGQVRSRAMQGLSDAITRTVMGRRFFITSKGRMGLAPAKVQLQDSIVLLKGCGMPLIIREFHDHWVVLGEAYIPGLMDIDTALELEGGQCRARMIQLK